MASMRHQLQYQLLGNSYIHVPRFLHHILSQLMIHELLSGYIQLQEVHLGWNAINKISLDNAVWSFSGQRHTHLQTCSSASTEYEYIELEVYKRSECPSGQTSSRAVVSSSIFWRILLKEVPLGVIMVVKADRCGRLQTPTSASLLHPEQLHFTLDFHTAFLQRPSWAQSLWKTSDKDKLFTKCI